MSRTPSRRRTRRCRQAKDWPSAAVAARSRPQVAGHLHVDQAVVEGRCTPDVGQALVGDFVDVGAARTELAPPDAEPVDDTGPRARADHRLAQVFPAVVEDTHLLAAANAAL